MTDQGSNKTGFARDDALKGDHAVRAADEDPLTATEEGPLDAAAPVAPAPSGMTPEGVSVRSDLARHLERSIYPAGRGALAETLRRHQAPDPLLDRVAGLPADAEYPNVQAVVRALGYGVEDRRD